MDERAKGRNDRSGFTLIETLVAMVCLTMVMGGAYMLIVQSAQISRMTRDHYIAVNLGKNRIERARNFAYSSLNLLAEDKEVVDENGNPNTLSNFRRTTVVDTNYSANVTQITVTVQMKSFKTGAWGAQETVASLFAQ